MPCIRIGSNFKSWIWYQGLKYHSIIHPPQQDNLKYGIYINLHVYVLWVKTKTGDSHERITWHTWFAKILLTSIYKEQGRKWNSRWIKGEIERKIVRKKQYREDIGVFEASNAEIRLGFDRWPLHFCCPPISFSTSFPHFSLSSLLHSYS